MKFNLNEAIARIVLIFLLGTALVVILKRLDWPEGVWRDVLTGAGAVVLSEVFFRFSPNQRKKND
jgi:hypothetical protein